MENRIVSLAPSNTEILFGLGKGADIVGVTAFCDYPEEAKLIPKVGSWTKVDMKKISVLQPDLCATSTFVQKPIADELEQKGFSVFHANPNGLEDVFASVEALARRTGVSEKGKALADGMRIGMSEIGFLRETDTVQPSLFVLEWNNPLTVSGNWVPEMVEIAGAVPVLARKGKPSLSVTTDQLIDANPDLIVVSLCGRGIKADPNKVFYNKELQRLGAFKSKSVYVVDDSLLNRPGPRLVEGLSKLTECIDDWKQRSFG
ncbi:MAG: cobalamin-binding protein [Candidatus Diapherotrites archaeon]|uniref:Cobalamin-binding protein n=1 Tax=Candidatus Iainarchaeum sp. TaxID=3101447 RepID=A0A8T4L814_9ARCH|nr:cobalamin-binding protein [Candidatus Diapherotrites archaeon]